MAKESILQQTKLETHGNCSTNLTCYDDYFILSRDPLFRGSVKSKKQEVLEKNRKNEYNGFMSPATKRKVRTILTTWIKAIDSNLKRSKLDKSTPPRRLTFVTLTLSQKQEHSDNEIKRKMLNRFLITCQRKHNVKYYFWRAEKQKNGNIHFHIVLDAFIDKRVIQDMWNNIQMDFNYLDYYFAINNHYKAPSTDVGVLQSKENAVAYVLKYVTKNPDDLKSKKLKVAGRIWSCSKELRELKPYSTPEDKPLITKLYDEVKAGNIEALDADFFTIFRCDTTKFLSIHFKDRLHNVNNYYVGVYDHLYSGRRKKNKEFKPPIEPVLKENWQPKQLSFDLGVPALYPGRDGMFDH